MRIGVIGPAEDPVRLEAALAMLLIRIEVDQVVFLGDEKILEQAVDGWSESLDRDRDAAFLDRAAQVALEGGAAEILALLDQDSLGARIGAVRKMPAAPARAIELVDDRVVLFVHDKSVLDEEDIANATVIVYGRSDDSVVKRFGKRAFVTPGPLSGGHVLVVEPGTDGPVVSVYDTQGATLSREMLGGTSGKVSVQ